MWKTVSLSGDNCPTDSTNCQVLNINDEVITVYNQAYGGRKCYGCLGVTGCSNVTKTVSPLCSTATCDYCNNLKATMKFDIGNLASVKEIAFTVQNERRSPRSLVITYSTDSIEGPFFYFNTYTMSSLVPGRYTFSSSNNQPAIGRYW